MVGSCEHKWQGISWLAEWLLSPQEGLLHGLSQSVICLCLPSGFFPLYFPTKILYFSSPPCLLHALPISSHLHDHPNNIWWRIQDIKIIMHFTPPTIISATGAIPNKVNNNIKILQTESLLYIAMQKSISIKLLQLEGNFLNTVLD